MRNSKGLRRLGAVLVVVVVIFGVMTATARQRPELTVVEKAIATIVYPFQYATDWVVNKVRGVGGSVGELVRLRNENEQLREKVRDSEQLEARYELAAGENLRLRAELHLKEQSDYPLLTAEVIGRSPDHWHRTVVINRGSRDGIQQNMAVVNWQGLVGKVAQTTPYTATVQLVTDAGFAAGSKLPTGELGVIETMQGGFVRMKFFSNNPEVVVGHPVFTSGQAVMPRNLLVGYVDSLDNGTGFDRFANVRPAVDFHKMDVVHVVMYVANEGEGAP